jgi:predicted aldo/keto reductase-like oxidoreductase
MDEEKKIYTHTEVVQMVRNLVKDMSASELQEYCRKHGLSLSVMRKIKNGKMNKEYPHQMKKALRILDYEVQTEKTTLYILTRPFIQF